MNISKIVGVDIGKDCESIIMNYKKQFEDYETIVDILKKYHISLQELMSDDGYYTDLVIQDMIDDLYIETTTSNDKITYILYNMFRMYEDNVDIFIEKIIIHTLAMNRLPYIILKWTDYIEIDKRM